MNPLDFPKLPLRMGVKVNPLAMNRMTEKNLRSQARFRDPFALKELRSLREGRPDSHRKSNLTRMTLPPVPAPLKGMLGRGSVSFCKHAETLPSRARKQAGFGPFEHC